MQTRLMWMGTTHSTSTSLKWVSVAPVPSMFRIEVYCDGDVLCAVVTAMDPHHSLTHEDMLYLWDIMCRWAKENNPEKANADGTFTLNFTEYLHGMADVKKHEKCKDWLDVNKVGL